eukprot:748294-Pyramimonas_sp.AAC.1
MHLDLETGDINILALKLGSSVLELVVGVHNYDASANVEDENRRVAELADGIRSRLQDRQKYLPRWGLRRRQTRKSGMVTRLE